MNCHSEEVQRLKNLINVKKILLFDQNDALVK